MPGQLHESLKASSPNEKPFSPTVVKPHARKLAKASRRSCERPGKNERTFEQPPHVFRNVPEHRLRDLSERLTFILIVRIQVNCADADAMTRGHVVGP